MATFSGGQVLQTVLGLGVVLAVFFALVVLVRRLPGFRTRNSGSIQIIGSMTLGNRDRLFLVKVADCYLLLGAGAQQLTLLHRFEGELPGSAVEESAGVRPAPAMQALLSAYAARHRP